MTLGLSDYSRRRRSGRSWGVLLKWAFVFIVIGGAGLYSYEIGGALATQEVKLREQEIARIAGENAALRMDLAGLEETVRQRETELAEWRARYARNVPAEDISALLTLIDQRLESGMPIERLETVIGAAHVDPPCDNQPVTKRFVLNTPQFTTAADTITFADGAITVTGAGASSRNADGHVQAWFDAAQPVTLRFASLGGDNTEVRGTLPLHHSLVQGDAEYRFSAVAGERSFVEITADRCDYP
jgi:hypothetical protein